MRLLRLATLAAVVALALAATAYATLTPKQYRAQANAACAKANAQNKALGTGQAMSNAQYAKYLVARYTVARQEYMSLRALQPPASLVAAHRQALWYLYDLLVLQGKTVAKIQAGADAATASASGASVFTLLPKELAAWGAAGVSVCASAHVDAKVKLPKISVTFGTKK